MKKKILSPLIVCPEVQVLCERQNKYLIFFFLDQFSILTWFPDPVTGRGLVLFFPVHGGKKC